MRMIRISFLALATLTAACTGYDTQVPLPDLGSSLKVQPLVGSIEIRDVSLPRYAAADEIVFLEEDGGLETVKGVLWADTPERAATQALVEDLSQITGARVASEPWPFAASPQAQIVVRVTRLYGAADGTFTLKGQYAISPVDSGLSDRSGQFDIKVPVQGETAQALANAQSRAFTQLSETIARRISR